MDYRLDQRETHTFRCFFARKKKKNEMQQIGAQHWTCNWGSAEFCLCSFYSDSHVSPILFQTNPSLAITFKTLHNWTLSSLYYSVVYNYKVRHNMTICGLSDLGWTRLQCTRYSLWTPFTEKSKRTASFFRLSCLAS